MGQMDFTNLEKLAKEIQKRANYALKVNVAPVITENMSDTIKEVTYMEYTPTEYERLGDDGGLSDIRNMQVEMLDDNTLSVTNERHDGSVDVARIVATGIGYTWTHSDIYQNPFARDFYADTIERLKRNQEHVRAMKDGLRLQGLQVEG